MFNRFLVVTIILFTFLVNSSAQEFNIRNRYALLSGAWYSAFELNNEPYVAGIAAHGYFSNYAVQLFFLKQSSDTIFNPAFLYQPDSSSWFYPNPVSIGKQNQIIISGGYGSGYPSKKCFFMKCDSDFHIKNLSTFEDSSKRTNLFVHATSIDNGYLCLSVFQKKFENVKEDFAIYKLDEFGDTIWTRDYIQPVGYSLIAQRIATFRNGYLIGGALNDIAAHFYNQSPKLFFTDTSGNLLWQRVLDDSIDGIHDWVINDDHSIVYCSKWGDSISQSQNLYTRAYLAKLDSNQNKVWEYRMGLSTLGTSYEAITKTKDGSYIAVGTGVSLPTDSGFRGTLIKFKDRGDSISIQWQRYYRAVTPKISVNFLYDVIERSNGSIVACGKSECYTDTFPQQGWILGLDSFGCLVPGCQNWNAIEDMPAMAQLRLYPNPVQSALYFDVSGIGNKKDCMVTISDGSGRQLAHIPAIDAATEYIADTKNYAPGIYFLKLYDHDQLLHVARFVKE
ncbi:MAG: T9SS type A sorting domain-containing protein [Chitinophagales bacterium]